MPAPNHTSDPSPSGDQAPRRRPSGSLGGRMLLLVVGAVLMTAGGLTAVSVHTAQSYLQRELSRTVPALLEGGDRRLRALLGRSGQQLAQAFS